VFSTLNGPKSRAHAPECRVAPRSVACRQPGLGAACACPGDALLADALLCLAALHLGGFAA
jgi:hypothetical protein